ncbi:MAG: ribonuclease [Candidatus Devosia euplotis]|nr:ribonuclease [Candidatus Devosia euplotis]
MVPGAQPAQRWVAVSCGTRSAQATDGATQPAPAQDTPRYRGTQYVLAVNWQPAFCETSPGKPECRSQTPASFEATYFTLHGLWPQPRDQEYCGVSENDHRASQNGQWHQLPSVRLDSDLRRDLDIAMPGTRSSLDRHEWSKRGTCYGASQAEYFADALDLLLAVNTSAAADLFAANIGRKITLQQVQAAFDTAFGTGAGQRVSMACELDGNRIITELTIGLTGTITGPHDMAALLAAADPATGGCRSGLVDPVDLR